MTDLSSVARSNSRRERPRSHSPNFLVFSPESRDREAESATNDGAGGIERHSATVPEISEIGDTRERVDDRLTSPEAPKELEALEDDKPLCCMPLVARRPALVCSILSVLLIGVTVTTVFVTTLDDIDVSIDSFSLDNSHFSVQNEDGLSAARSDWAVQVSSSTSVGRRMSSISQWDLASDTHVGGTSMRRQLSTQYLLGYLEVLYMPRDATDNESSTAGFLTEDNFRRIHEREKLILESDGFSKFCMGSEVYTDENTVADDYRVCSPPSSILSYFYPSVDNVTGEVSYDGFGDTMLPFTVTLSLLAGVESAYSFLSAGSSFSNHDSKFVKSLFTFAVPFPTDTDEYHEIHAEFTEFCEYLSERFTTTIDTDPKVRVVHGGTYITTYEVYQAVYHDCYLAILSLIFVTIYSIAYIRSTYLALVGIVQILCTLPITYLVCYFAFGLDTLGIMNVLSLYLLLGIGVDDLYVFKDSFERESATDALVRGPTKFRCCHKSLDDDEVRLAKDGALARVLSRSYRSAAKAMFVTSFTTSAAFLANLFTIIPVIRDFVLFMALSVILNYIFAISVFPAHMAFWSRRVRPCERDCALCFKCQGRTRRMAVLPKISHRPPRVLTALTDANDVVLEEVAGGSLQTHESDEDLHSAEDDALDPAVAAGDKKNLCTKCLKNKIAPCLWLAAPVRSIAVTVSFVVLTAVAAYCCSNLQPATGIPNIFADDNNIQIYLSSLAEFSGAAYLCTSPTAFSKRLALQ